jgi:hypothetical protein
MDHLPVTQNFSDGAEDPLIFKLHEELVWRIFLLNADLNDEITFDAGQSLAAPRGQDPAFTTNGLTVTRRTSQVCRSWRSLILSSTAIWGRVIDLHILKHASQMWSHEVLKRTGEAPLDIKGELLGMSPTMTPFFSFLVQHHWARIRSLDISIFGVQWIREDAWDFLKQPAPNMQVCSIYFHDGYTDKPNFFSETDMGLFANGAASLRELRITHMTFEPDASWLAQLRHLDLASPFSLHQLFEVLKHTPVLEKLILRRQTIDDPESASEPSQIILPRLRSINIAHRLTTCLTVLESIVPTSGCGLTILARDTNIVEEAPLSTAEITRLRLTISRFSKAYFSVWKATQVYLEVAVHTFRFEGRFTSDEMRLPPISAPEFNIHLENSNGFPRQASLSILDDLAGNSFVDVSTLIIHIFPPMLHPVDSQFTTFILSLPSVNELRATPYALGLLINMSHPLQDGKSSPAAVFRQLRTLVVDSEFDQLSIASFLEWKRRIGGTAIDVLDLTNVKVHHADEVGEAIGSFDGLKVLRGPTQVQRTKELNVWLANFKK